MTFVTKVWKDRLVEYAGRRKLKNVATGAEVLYDVTRSEGTVSQAGDAFSASNMNNLEQRIKNEFDTVNNSLGGLKFAQDAEGNWGYKPSGADSVTPFSGIAPEEWTISFPGMNDASYTHLFTLQIPYGYKKLKYESAVWASVTSNYGVHGIADGVDVKIGNERLPRDIDITMYTHISFYLQYAWYYITFYK